MIFRKWDNCPELLLTNVRGIVVLIDLAVLTKWLFSVLLNLQYDRTEFTIFKGLTNETFTSKTLLNHSVLEKMKKGQSVCVSLADSFLKKKKPK